MPVGEDTGAAEAAERLLALALSRPQEALAQAHRLAASSDDARVVSFARQAAGIVLRDSGQTTAALVELRAALRAARSTGDGSRSADVRATLGAALVMAGRTVAGLEQLDAAADDARGALLARVLMRRAFVLSGLGRHPEALADMRHALAGFRRTGDTLWEARALNNRSLIHLARGSLTRAEQDVVRAEVLFLAAGQDLEAVLSVHNRGVLAYCRGDLPRALASYAEAAQRYAGLGVASPDLVVDRSQAFLAAGLTTEAADVVEEALAGPSLQPPLRADLLLVAASAALAGGRADAALARARAARTLLRRQDRRWRERHAELVVVQARVAAGGTGAALLASAAALGADLRELRSESASVALLVAGRLAVARRSPSAPELLTAAARYRRHPSALVRATGWLARATERDAADDRRGVYAACSRGLDALDEHQRSLGSSELRALATTHGRDLAALALRRAAAGGEARRLLAWSERWRATALVPTPVRPPRDPVLAGRVGVLRSQERAHEQAVRARLHQLPGATDSGARGTGEDRAGRRLDVAALVDALRETGSETGQGTTLVELVDVDGVLLAVTVGAGRVRRHLVGPVADALAAVAAARFVLRQAARGRPTSLTGIGERLQLALLGPAAAALGDGPVVVSPPGRLHATPWSLLPALAGRAVTGVPSAAMWLRARASTPPAGPDPGLVLVAGPGLRSGGAEVDVLARADPAARLLRDGSATVAGALEALDGSRLAHVAAHGRFRPDSPMFSALLLDDGPLTVHDFELLRRAPRRLVLSACDSGVMVPVGADELLGLASALLSLGTVGIVSSIAEVNDEATVDLMVDLHRDLARGVGLGEALLHARERAGEDLVARATAAAFVALGI